MFIERVLVLTGLCLSSRSKGEGGHDSVWWSPQDEYQRAGA